MDEIAKDQAPIQDTDALVGKNLAKLRLASGRSQKELADGMRAIGHRWSQNTVWNVEHGERPLRFTEGAALCDLLGVPMAALLAVPDEERPLMAELMRAAKKRREVLAVVADVQEAVARTLSRWQTSIEKFEEAHGPDEVRRAIADATRSDDSQLDPGRLDQFVDDLRALSVDPPHVQYEKGR